MLIMDNVPGRIVVSRYLLCIWAVIEVLGSVINVGVDLFQILLHLKGFV